MSLRARLLLAVGAVALVALVAADIVTYTSLDSFLVGRVDQSLQTAHVPVENALVGGGPGGPPAPGPGPARAPGPAPAPGRPGADLSALSRVEPGTFVEVRGADGAVLAEQPAYVGGGTSTQPQLPGQITGYSSSADPNGEPTVYFDAPSTTAGQSGFRVRASRLADGDVLVLAESLADTNATLHRLLLVELAVTGGALVLAGLLGWWLVRVGFRPLAAIERTAGAIAEGDLGHRAPGESQRTEVGRLAASLNAMLGRIEGAFAARDATEAELRRSEARLRRFVADASHELRTPVAAVSAYSELFERGADVRPADLARVMSGIRLESARMGRLVDDLLLLARLDEGLPLEQAPVDLSEVAVESSDAARAVGPEWPVVLTVPGPVVVSGDRTRLRQVLDNLLANVRAHTPAGTTANVVVTAEGEDAVLAIADDGPGIDPDDAARIFERFYRSDPSRSRQSGGTGLGLSIVGAIVSAHGGTVSAASRAEGGSIFTVRLPVVEAQVAETQVV
ncbi:MAG TPA: HAMP domain-containing sensor histidine kinase [Acidimicrobiales bacterium]|nr:HAMP domain-containing sensor histidine kinase [Acidimicrobiales bacterium]